MIRNKVVCDRHYSLTDLLCGLFQSIYAWNASWLFRFWGDASVWNVNAGLRPQCKTSHASNGGSERVCILWPTLYQPICKYGYIIRIDYTFTLIAIIPILDNAKRGILSQGEGSKVDVDLWPSDPKSIEFLPSSSTTYMWSLKVIGQKL